MVKSHLCCVQIWLLCILFLLREEISFLVSNFFPLDNKTFDKNRVSDETVKSLPFLWQSQKKIIGWNRKTLITYCVLNDKKMELRNSLTKRNKIRYTMYIPYCLMWLLRAKLFLITISKW
jgi:hypothetical protein